MRVLAIASRKGGAGKTTITGHLAVAAEQAGCGPVAIVDLDPQGSLADWWNRRGPKHPYFVQTTMERLADDITAMRRLGIKLLLIDTPPVLSLVIKQVITLSDLVLLPVRPSPHDLRSIGATLTLVEQLDKPFLFVLNAASRRARLTEEARTLLSQCGQVAASTLHSRVDFASSMVDGRTVMEIAGGEESSIEVNMLWREVHFLIEKLNARDRAPGAEQSAAGIDSDSDTLLGEQVIGHG